MKYKQGDDGKYHVEISEVKSWLSITCVRMLAAGKPKSSEISSTAARMCTYERY
jgi:hypothetical protein